MARGAATEEAMPLLLRDKINLLRESMQASEANHRDAAAALASAAARMAAIDDAVQPAEVRSL